MNVGSLFFKLGFQADGMGDAAQFNNTTVMLEQNTQKLLTVMNSMADSLNDLALKFGAITEAEHLLNRQVRDFGALTKKNTDGLDKQNKPASNWQKNLKNISGGVKELTSYLNPMTLAATVAGSALAKMALNAANIGGSLKLFSNLTGVSTDRIQILERKFSQFGVSAEEVQESVKGMIETSNKIKLGDETSIRAYAVLGLTPDMDPEQKMKRVAQAADRFKDKSMFAMFAKEAGLSEKIINGLVQGAMDIKVDQNALMSPQSVERAAKFERSWEGFKQNLADGASKIGTVLMPMLQPALDLLDNMMVGFREIANLVTMLQDTVPGIASAFKVLGIAIATFFLGPIVAVVAALNDLVNFIRGKDSIIGDIGAALGFDIEQGPKIKGNEGMKPLGVRSGSATNNSMTDNRTNNYQIEINGASDPLETAKQIRKLQDQDNANAYFSTFAGAQ